jgi:hypothetical protein
MTTFSQVNDHTWLRVGVPCKTVGSAYPGSNPGPATSQNRNSGVPWCPESCLRHAATRHETQPCVGCRGIRGMGGHGSPGWAHAERSPGHRGGETALPGLAHDPARCLPRGNLAAGLPNGMPGSKRVKGKVPMFSAKSIMLPWAAVEAVLGICRECPPGWPLVPAHRASFPKA